MRPDVAIVGGGPTAVYTLQALIEAGFRGRVTLFESGPRVGVGMPYDPRYTHPALLANIASVEIPPLGPTLADWADALAPDAAARLGLTQPLGERDFPPRILLGAYFADGLARLVAQGAAQGVRVVARANCPVVDVGHEPAGVRVSFGGAAPGAALFDHVVLATGHVWPRSDDAGRGRFASPWPSASLVVPGRARVAVLGSSLSAIDAAVTLALDAGRFVPAAGGGLRYRLRQGRALQVTFFSRGGLLPEADFFHITPYLPLGVCTPDAVAAQIAAGPGGLLDRVFALIAAELARADPFYARLIGLPALTADSLADAYFASRSATDPFRHARENLGESRENARRRRTVAWRYALLRMHESVAGIVPHLTPLDRARFDAGLKRLFMDNYAAVPLASVERLIALHDAGVLAVERIGPAERFQPAPRGVTLTRTGRVRAFEALIDARGQRALRGADLPFATLRRQIAGQCDADGYLAPDAALQLAAMPGCAGTLHCAAIAFLLRRQPFVQGIVETARLGRIVAGGIMGAAGGRDATPLRRSA